MTPQAVESCLVGPLSKHVAKIVQQCIKSQRQKVFQMLKYLLFNKELPPPLSAFHSMLCCAAFVLLLSLILLCSLQQVQAWEDNGINNPRQCHPLVEDMLLEEALLREAASFGMCHCLFLLSLCFVLCVCDIHTLP